MDIKDTFCYMVGAYYGIQEMDSYDLKEYILKNIENYIKEFVEENKSVEIDFYEEAERVRLELSLKTKLQDSLLVLPKVNAPMELILLVKARLKEIREEELEEM